MGQERNGELERRGPHDDDEFEIVQAFEKHFDVDRLRLAHLFNADQPRVGAEIVDPGPQRIRKAGGGPAFLPQNGSGDVELGHAGNPLKEGASAISGSRFGSRRGSR